MKRLRQSQDAFILASLLISVSLITTMGIIILQLVLTNFQVAAKDVYRLDAQLASDAGLDSAIVELNQDNSWTGSGGEVDLITSSDGSYRSTYETTVVDGGATGEKTVISTGRVYTPASASTPSVMRRYEIEIEGLTPASGTFSLVTGVGGLIMKNNSKIVAGDVFVNGEIEMFNSSQIGLSTAPVTVNAAHQNCPDPPGASYPTICDSAVHGAGIGEPIVLQNEAHIYADVYANNQSTTSGLSDGGLQAGTVTPEALPPHDREAQIAAVDPTNDLPGVNCDSNSATLTWPANTHITGNVFLKKQCKVIVEGDVWIDGVLEMTQSTQLITDEGTGTTRPVIMVDGSVFLKNSSKLVANSQDAGLDIVTYRSAVACSIASVTPCDVTGSNLYNSRNIITIELDNSASGPESLLYAKYSRLTVKNSGDIGALVGQTVELNNSATITFGASTDGMGGTTPSTFVVRSYKRTF